MRLCTYLRDGHEILGVVAKDRALPLNSLGNGLPGTLDELLLAEQTTRDEIAGLVSESHDEITASGSAVDSLDLLAPVPRPGKIVGAGRNYLTHAEEEGADMPERPLLFAKFSSSLIGNGKVVRWHGDQTSQVDWEAELAVVIGRPTYRVPEEEAMGSVFGYTCLNDISARDLQLGDGQWVRGKSLDTFCPMGPVLVTSDEIDDPHALEIRCLVNGEVMQDDVTGSMHFKIPTLISFASQAFSLMPGDVIATGTPSGVGVYRDPPVFLGDGDEVVVEIADIGSLRNTCQVITT